MSKTPWEPRYNGARRCTSCKQDAEGRWEDNGIGSYEFWGTPGDDSQLDFVSTCCEAPLEEMINNRWVPLEIQSPPTRIG